MTPEQRIAQLAAARGGVAPRRVPRPTAVHCEPTPMVPGANVQLKNSWRNIKDVYENREHRDCLKRLELRLAAGVVARCLGKGWSVHEPKQRRGIEIQHVAGYRFAFSWCWRRFSASRIDSRHSITVSATRPLGAIAADINRRLVDGMAEEWEQLQASRKSRRRDLSRSYRSIEAIAKAFSGRVKRERHRRDDPYPSAVFAGGSAKIAYGFVDRREIEFVLNCDTETAVAIGEFLASRQ